MKQRQCQHCFLMFAGDECTHCGGIPGVPPRPPSPIVRHAQTVKPTRMAAAHVIALSRHLMRLVEPLRHHPAGHEAIEEISAVVAAARWAVDAPEARYFPVGPCPEFDDRDINCPGTIRANIPRAADARASMECSRCDTVYETWQWHRAGKRILERKAQLPMWKPA